LIGSPLFQANLTVPLRLLFLRSTQKQIHKYSLKIKKSSIHNFIQSKNIFINAVPHFNVGSLFQRGFSSSNSNNDETNCENSNNKREEMEQSSESHPKQHSQHSQQITQIDFKRKMTMIFTCNVCTTRSAKTFHKVTYQRGVVIVRCEACKTLHLVADHLGWFEGAQKTIEEMLALKGENVRKITDKRAPLDPNTFEILPNDSLHESTLPPHILTSQLNIKN
jgi:hypothetical protein